MLVFVCALGLLVGSGVAALLAARAARVTTAVGAGGAVIACLGGLVAALRVLLGAPVPVLRVAWDVPYGAFFVEVDALSAFFLVPIFGLCGLAAVYGSESLLPRGRTRSLGPVWFFFNLLVASMALVVMARNAILFLVAWEVMALASFFLVTFDDDQESVRAAGWTYLVATHLGTAFLLALFVLLGRHAGSFDFDRFIVAPGDAGVLFLLGVIGFGAKAGIVPLHVWLPDAHPAAPSHVSAVMSGVMIKTGIYGLLRILTVLGPPPALWGWLLVAIGLSTGIFGVLFALAQGDLKRMLAYSSVENIGIIVVGLGIGVLGRSAGSPELMVLGFGGALLHIVNHAALKGMLFLAAGAVAHASGTRNMERLGGLLKRMPFTGAAFVLGAVAMCGVPPLNGSASELLLYLGAFLGLTALPAAGIGAGLTIGGLALMGGLAAACFSRAVGIVFLGEPRTASALQAHEAGPLMRFAMLLLAAVCVLLSGLAPLVVGSLAPVIEQLAALPPDAVRFGLVRATTPLWYSMGAAAVVLGLSGCLAALRRWLLSGRTRAESVTWDCAYVQPSVRMQYTASSFAQPLTTLFGQFLQTDRDISMPRGFFPRHAALRTETTDVCRERIYRPLFGSIARGLASLRWLQHGEVHLYVLYIAVTLVVLLLWLLGWRQ